MRRNKSRHCHCPRLTVFSSFQGFLVESKLTKLLAPLERDEQSLMKLDAIFAVGIFRVLEKQHFSV